MVVGPLDKEEVDVTVELNDAIPKLAPGNIRGLIEEC